MRDFQTYRPHRRNVCFDMKAIWSADWYYSGHTGKVRAPNPFFLHDRQSPETKARVANVVAAIGYPIMRRLGV